QLGWEQDIAPSARAEYVPDITPQAQDFPLGAARAQIHENYIIAQNEHGLVIIDQHAAHERLVYEDFKAQLEENGVEKQGLLMPEIISLAEDQIESILKHAEALNRLGLEVEAFGPGALAVQTIPALLAGRSDVTT